MRRKLQYVPKIGHGALMRFAPSSRTGRMNGIALHLSNVPPRIAGDEYEHLFPERNPRWRFARLYDPAPPFSELAAGLGTDDRALALTATPHGPRVGGSATADLALWIVLTNAVDGNDAEFNDWYDARHIHDSLAIPGFVSGRRYRVTSAAGPDDARWSYLALYEIELTRAAEALAEAAVRAGGPQMPNPGYLAPGAAALPFRPMR
jgi:hypothetical protein